MKNVDVDHPPGHADTVSPAFPARARVRWSTRSSTSAWQQSSTAPVPARGAFDRIDGLEHLDKVINIDQSRPSAVRPAPTRPHIPACSAISGRSSPRRKTPKPVAMARAAFPSMCGAAGASACGGGGLVKIEMHFLPDIYVPCEVCRRQTVQPGDAGGQIQGQKHQRSLGYDGGRSPAVSSKTCPRSTKDLQTLYDVGLGYVKIGQPSTTLSGGEAQRVKLATELGQRRATGRTIYILDEPDYRAAMWPMYTS